MCPMESDVEKIKIKIEPSDSSIEFLNLLYTLSGTIGLSIFLQTIPQDMQCLLQHPWRKLEIL